MSPHGEELGRGEESAQTIHPMHPETPLHHLPVQHWIATDEGIHRIDHFLVESTEISHRFRRHAEFLDDDPAKAIGNLQVPGSAISAAMRGSSAAPRGAEARRGSSR